MAIEDEIINITDIDVGTEILNNDRLIIETNNGTKLVAFKDLVIGEDNITFKDKLVQKREGQDLNYLRQKWTENPVVGKALSYVEGFFDDWA